MIERQAVSPASADVTALILRAEQRHPDLVKVRRMGVTAEGRPIHAVTITDPSVADREKQHVLIAAGHHGNEESGRLAALALIGWLTSPSALEVRRKQKIVVMPNMNPDSAERDVYDAPDRPRPFRDHAPSGPQLAEGKALEEVAYELEPELYVDMHARGYAGCSYDMVLWSEPATYTEDDYLLHRIAAEMAEAGERAGIPNVAHPLSWPGFMSESPDVSSACAFAYRRFKSLPILTETCESNEYAYPARDRVRSGLAKLKALLAWGNRRHPKLHYAGYPCYLIGMFQKGLVPVGKTAAARRRGRIALWRNWNGFKAFEVEAPEKPDEKRLKVEYAGPALACGAGFQVAVRGSRTIRSVRVNGRKLRSSESNGYYTWRQGCSTFIVVALADLQPGKYGIVIAHAPAERP
ncbi:MAG: M14 family zinc carboxypeptidase [Armatimonadota bacterium]